MKKLKRFVLERPMTVTDGSFRVCIVPIGTTVITAETRNFGVIRLVDWVTPWGQSLFLI